MSVPSTASELAALNQMVKVMIAGESTPRRMLLPTLLYNSDIGANPGIAVAYIAPITRPVSPRE